MLHVILTILKVIGIILLIILALVLLLILAVLFVPVRYSIRAKKEDGPPQAYVSAAWLMHLLRAEAYWKDGSGQISLKALRFTLKTWRFPGGDGGGLTRKKHTKAPGDDRDPHRKNEGGSAGGPGNPGHSDPGRAENSGLTGPDAHDEKPAGDAFSTDRGRNTGREDTSGGSGMSGRAAAALEKIQELLARLAELIPQIPDISLEASEKIAAKLEKLTVKIEGIKKKIKPFLTAEADHVYLEIIDLLGYIWRGWRIRTAEGYVEFGTGSPDTTGILTGLIWMLLPAGSEGYSVSPDFYEQEFRTDTSLTGKARLYRLAYAGVKLIKDREFRKLLHMVRGGSGKKHREKGRNRRRRHG